MPLCFFSAGVFLALTLDPHTKTMSDAEYKLRVAAMKRRTVLRGCLLAMGQFVSEAIKVMPLCVMVSSHFSFHGQSGAIHDSAEKSFGSKLKIYIRCLNAGSVSIRHPRTVADDRLKFFCVPCFRCVPITRRVWFSPFTRTMAWDLERCRRPTRCCRTGR